VGFGLNKNRAEKSDEKKFRITNAQNHYARLILWEKKLGENKTFGLQCSPLQMGKGVDAKMTYVGL